MPHSLPSSVTTSLLSQLGDSLNCDFGSANLTPVTGGDINTCYQLSSIDRTLFIKMNASDSAAAMFAAEDQALKALVHCPAFRVPQPVHQGCIGDLHYLAMEFVALSSSGDWEEFGRALSQLHTIGQDQYGWSSDNFIGTTPQINTACEPWVEFWWQNRLLPQLERVGRAGHQQLFSLKDRLRYLNDAILGNHQPAPSLLHGDLWSGNAAFDESGKPCLYDPASYYGDRETDIALSELFGGFPSQFYQAYSAELPLAAGYSLRKQWYNLYHLLNHANLFGGHYPAACVHQIDQISQVITKS